MGQTEVNYSCFSHLDFNQDDQEGHECYPNVFIEETGVLMDGGSAYIVACSSMKRSIKGAILRSPEAKIKPKMQKKNSQNMAIKWPWTPQWVMA